MINQMVFTRFRNLSGVYKMNQQINCFVGANSSGKSNLLDGVRLAFAILKGEYFKIQDSDFFESNTENSFEIEVLLDENSIPSLSNPNPLIPNTFITGFKVMVTKNKLDRFFKKITHLDGSPLDIEVLRSDETLPKIFSVPLIRIEDIYTGGLSVGLSDLIESEEKYNEIYSQSSDMILKALDKEGEKFKNLCSKFNHNLKIAVYPPKITNEKIYIVDGDKPHNSKIGSGYKSIANIMLNAIDNDKKILLIDELENHLHPSLIRTLIRELRDRKEFQLISTSHSSIVLDELNLEEITYISGTNLSNLNYYETDETIIKNQLTRFLHAGRNELILNENIVLVEGYTEEMLLKHYIKKANVNWTVINVAGVMFKPYIILARTLTKRIIVISDTDKGNTEDCSPSPRFNNLKDFCHLANVTLIDIDNTLESDLYINGFISSGYESFLMKHDKHKDITVCKKRYKTELAQAMINKDVDLTEWHVIKGIYDEFTSI
ncbi:MAG: AAA family ATPase [Acholeplasmataceae bacterium]|nr:AAA family ATPase [Acholeplasmataceae bacterium]